MKTILLLCAILVASLLVMIAGQNSNSQESSGDLSKGLTALRPEQRMELLKPALSELLQDREMKRELAREISRSMGPESMKVLAESISSECARDPQFRKEVLRAVVGAASSQMKEMFASAGHGNRSLNSAALMSLISAVTSRGISGGRIAASGKASGQPGEQRVNREPELWGDSVAAFVNPENHVKTLSADQARKLFTGEFTNWKQVGGPDISVEVVSWNEGLAELEDLVGKRVAPGAVKLRYLTLMIPAVSRSRGAVGFLPTGSVEQLPFIAGHEAIRSVAVVSDSDTAPVTADDQVVDRETHQTIVGPDKGVPSENWGRLLVTLTAK